MKKIIIYDDIMVKICLNSNSMAQAHISYMNETNTKLGFTTFLTHSKKINCHNPNKSGKGNNKTSNTKFSLTDILMGKHPTFQSNKLRKRLITESIFEHKCVMCENTVWNGKPIPLEVDHINGVHNDHRLDNLRLLCPNCHAQTDTYKGKNISTSVEK